jgi:hypothetical protein
VVRCGAAPQDAAEAVAGDRGLDGVLFQLAGDERLAPGPTRPWPANSDLGAVDAQPDAFGGGVGEHVGEGA